MSCKNCDKHNEGQQGVAYYRWKNANIGMMGCNIHLREIFDALSQAQKSKPCHCQEEDERHKT